MTEPTVGLTEPVDFESDVPVYEQIGNRLKFAVARGAYAPGDRLPSVRALARSLLVNPNTIVRVYRELEGAGLIESQRGRGVFVTRAAARRCQRERTTIVEERLREAIALARRAALDDDEIEALLARLLAEDATRPDGGRDAGSGDHEARRVASDV